MSTLPSWPAKGPPRLFVLLLLALAFGPGGSVRAADPGFDAQFTMRAYGATVGRAHWVLSAVEGAQLTMSAESGTAGMAALVKSVKEREVSTLQRFDGSLRPVRYRYERTGDKRARTAEMTLDWKAAVARGTSRGEAWELALEPGTLDGLSLVLAMIADLRAGLTQMDYTVIDEGRFKHYRMKVAGNESLDTALGTQRSVRVDRQREDDRATSYWFAPALGHMPVRIRHEERDGWSVEMSLESLNGQPPPDLRFR